MTQQSHQEPSPDQGEGQFGRAARAFVLLILAQRSSYGYEIRRRLETDFDYRRAATDPGALYRLLREMEAAGFIRSHWDIAGTGPARRYYEMTDAGKDELRRGAERLRRQAGRIRRFLDTYGQWSDAEAGRPDERLLLREGV